MKLYRDVCYKISARKKISHNIILVNDNEVGLAKGHAPQQVQNIQQNPWEVQHPYLREIFSEANRAYWGPNQTGNPRTFFPGQTYASFSPQTEQALNLTEQRAMAGSPVQQAANQELMRTIGGEYLYGGPGFNAAYQAAANKIIPDVESRFARGGRLNSGLARTAEAQALSDAFASQYAQERQNQLRGMFFAPEAAASDYKDIQALAGVGQAREGQTQSAIDEAMARHDFAQYEQANRLAEYLALIQGNYGGNTQQINQGFKGNKGAGILGGALGGAGAGAQFGPWGAAGGAALGGLLGAFA